MFDGRKKWFVYLAVPLAMLFVLNGLLWLILGVCWSWNVNCGIVALSLINGFALQSKMLLKARYAKEIMVAIHLVVIICFGLLGFR